MLSAVGLADVRADLDSLSAWLDAMVKATGGAHLVIPASRAPGPNEVPAGQDASVPRARIMPGTARAIAWGLELPALARRRFSANSGCVLADVGKKLQAGDDAAARHPAAKVAALSRADLADGLAWRYDCDCHAWGYAALRWLLVDPGDAAGTPDRPAASRVNVSKGDVARLGAATAKAAESARHSGVGNARQALVRQLSAGAGRLLHGQRGQVNRELMAVTAEATLLTGYLTYACWPLAALAQAYFVQALALAHACRDRQLGAAVLCAMSEQAVFNGHLDEARNLVNTAINGTCDAATPELSAHLRLLSARDHMYRNELTSCVRALKDAVTEFDRLTEFSRLTGFKGAMPGREPGWTRWLTDDDLVLFALVLASAYRAAGLGSHWEDLRARTRSSRSVTVCPVLSPISAPTTTSPG